QLASNMTSLATNTAGSSSGSSQTAMAATNKQILVSPLRGIQQHPSAKRHPTFGFSVHLSPLLCLSQTLPHSTTAFVGQCFMDHCGKETLEPMWLLQEEVLSHKATWKATR
ncbi:AVID protein, partial [Prunella fulvescens]|nr:AVID protein [Prunella fulvescens]